MNNYIRALEEELSIISNGYKVIEKKALDDYKSCISHEDILSKAYCAYESEIYQVRMYGVFLFGYLSTQEDVLLFMKKKVVQDSNWRVQEILAKSFDYYCCEIGYHNALPMIDEWLSDDSPNCRRAVCEGLRIWTSRPYFKDNPKEAISRLVNLNRDKSEYVRKSVGNALRDISKKFPNLIKDEIDTWILDDKEIKMVYKLASKFL